MPHYIYAFTDGLTRLISGLDNWPIAEIIAGGMLILTPILSYWRLRARSPAPNMP